MKRLTTSEILDLSNRLTEWQTPIEMRDLVSSTMDDLGSTNFFNQSGLAFIRDAWIASEFGWLRDATSVRLVPDNWPDFELSIAGRVESFEAVEADNPERRRGLDYRHGLDEVVGDPIEDWIARAEMAPSWLKAACQKKAEKRYSGRTGLVVYLNLDECGIRQSEVEACFPSATASVKDAFEAVWVLWKKKAYRVWP